MILYKKGQIAHADMDLAIANGRELWQKSVSAPPSSSMTSGSFVSLEQTFCHTLLPLDKTALGYHAVKPCG